MPDIASWNQMSLPPPPGPHASYQNAEDQMKKEGLLKKLNSFIKLKSVKVLSPLYSIRIPVKRSLYKLLVASATLVGISFKTLLFC